MVDYPKQVCCFWAEKVSLDARCELVAPSEEDNIPPLEFHKGNISRFVITLLDRKSGVVVPVSANIPGSEVRAIMEKMRIALIKKALYVPSAADQKSPAYTTVMRNGIFEGKTPAEILLEDANNRQKLMKQREWLAKNLKQYPGNKKQIAAIDAAIELQEIGELAAQKSDPNGAEVYARSHKHGRKSDTNGYYHCFDIAMRCNFEMTYAWSVKIINYDAKLKKSSKGTSVIDESTIRNRKSSSINLSDDDFISFIGDLDDMVRMFKQSNYAMLMKRANQMSKQQYQEALAKKETNGR